MADLKLALQLALACERTYTSSPAQWEDEAKTVHAFLSVQAGVHTIAFEGTSKFVEWLIDFMAIDNSVADHAAFGAVHRGFMRDVLLVGPAIANYLDGLGWPPFLVTGHSKGAAEALLFTAWMKQLGHPPLATWAFEAPRVGTAILRDYVDDLDISQTSTINAHGKDIVTRVPFEFGWVDVREPILLPVPDDYDIPTQHRMPAVVSSLQALQPQD